MTNTIIEPSEPKKLQYRPDIDGLRGVSVLLVLLFHTAGLVPGGFIGVDVFFVISGFLITSIIQYEIDQEKFLCKNFWARRVRRILPASLVCIVGTLILSSFVMLPNDFANMARSAFASSIGLAKVLAF